MNDDPPYNGPAEVRADPPGGTARRAMSGGRPTSTLKAAAISRLTPEPGRMDLAQYLRRKQERAAAGRVMGR